MKFICLCFILISSTSSWAQEKDLARLHQVYQCLQNNEACDRFNMSEQDALDEAMQSCEGNDMADDMKLRPIFGKDGRPVDYVCEAKEKDRAIENWDEREGDNGGEAMDMKSSDNDRYSDNEQAMAPDEFKELIE